MTVNLRKLSFQEAWDTLTIFYVDEELEDQIDQEVEKLLEIARNFGLVPASSLTTGALARLLQQEGALEFVLREIGLSEEKFMRMISLLRRIGRIPDPLLPKRGQGEWSLKQIIRRIQVDADFSALVADLLLDGARDADLRQVIPRYYLDMLNLQEIATDSEAARRARYKSMMLGTYSGRKGHRVESCIQRRIENLRQKHGVGFEKGRSRFVNVDIDFAIPSLDDPWVIVMSSFQETTSSAQSTKARDMLEAYQAIQRVNARYGEKRVFVNFADGGGWLARKRDFQRLVQNCDYFINLHHLDMLEPIVLTYVPSKYFDQSSK